MFINFWYTAGRSTDVTDTPVRRRMLGQDFVLFRDTTGRVRCLADTCIHRGASLGLGKVKGDCIQCPYHGWQFGGDGACRGGLARSAAPHPAQVAAPIRFSVMQCGQSIASRPCVSSVGSHLGSGPVGSRAPIGSRAPQTSS